MHGKLKLDLNELAVESFDTSETAERNGTVFGEQCTCWTNCTCPGCPSCDGCPGTEHTACNQASCAGTCGASCNGTCAGQNTCGNSCDCWGTMVDATCNGYGTCGVYPCRIVP